MQTKNELILDKLIELGAINRTDEGWLFGNGTDFSESEFDEPVTSDAHCVIFDALVSECGKRDLTIQIETFSHGGEEIWEEIWIAHMNKYGEIKKIVFKAEYSRQSIAEAFCKVVGISEVSDE